MIAKITITVPRSGWIAVSTTGTPTMPSAASTWPNVGGSGFSVAIGFGAGVADVAGFPRAPGEVFRPAYWTSRGYFTNVNTSNTRVNITNVTNIYNNTYTNIYTNTYTNTYNNTYTNIYINTYTDIYINSDFDGDYNKHTNYNIN